MSVRVVARIRPLWEAEREADVILRIGTQPAAARNDKRDSQNKRTLSALTDRDAIVRIPNPKNNSEEYSFQFSGVYDAGVSQQELFDAEVAPTTKHLFNGFDVTLFAYGVTGTGKTHTMRGGKRLADRGVIPRLLSSIYRRGRKIEKDTAGDTTVKVSLSYYEIYNDKVFDLLEPPEKRTFTGLPLRDNGGKTVVVGLTERPCTSLKEFELLYDQANVNRSTSATKLNAHSSRSHAILCVKLTITTGDRCCISTASAIDLAGSEDNRRTDNSKERMIESASINKSLFVLAQCVEAISKKHSRIPYRESKLTRILSLGQNNGLTVMILNLAPVRSYHLDTISSLNFANRTKKIEIREVENEPIFKGPPRALPRALANSQRQPLQSLASSVNVNLGLSSLKNSLKPESQKPTKAFHVYADRPQLRKSSQLKRPEIPRRTSTISNSCSSSSFRTSLSYYTQPSAPAFKQHDTVMATKIEEMVERKVEEILAVRAANEEAKKIQAYDLNEKVQRRLDLIEQRIVGSEDARAEGLSYLLMGKQHQARGEDAFALKMYRLALPFFPLNKKLACKISTLQERIQNSSTRQHNTVSGNSNTREAKRVPENILFDRKQHDKDRIKRSVEYTDETYHVAHTDVHDRADCEKDAIYRTKQPKRPRTESPTGDDNFDASDDKGDPLSPRTAYLLSVINTRDISQIRLLKGVGVKKAEAIVDCLCEMDNINEADDKPLIRVNSLAELGKLKGVGKRTLLSMREGALV